MAFTQSTSGRPRSKTAASSKSRPTTALGFHDDEDEAEEPVHGTTVTEQSPLASKKQRAKALNALPVRRVRVAQSAQQLRSKAVAPRQENSGRQISISTAFSLLDLHNMHKEGGRVASHTAQGGRPQSRDVSTTSQSKAAAAPDAPPKTPPPWRPSTRHLEEAMTGFKESWTAFKTPCSVTSPSPSRQPFLTRFSNTRNFAARDLSERIETIDTHFQKFQEAMADTMAERKIFDQALEVLKKKGE